MGAVGRLSFALESTLEESTLDSVLIDGPLTASSSIKAGYYYYGDISRLLGVIKASGPPRSGGLLVVPNFAEL